MRMQDKRLASSLPFPSPPAGLSAMEHRPTMEGRVKFWRAVCLSARRAGDERTAGVAEALRESYEQAHGKLAEHSRIGLRAATDVNALQPAPARPGYCPSPTDANRADPAASPPRQPRRSGWGDASGTELFPESSSAI
jgi:hypothetical protein